MKRLNKKKIFLLLLLFTMFLTLACAPKAVRKRRKNHDISLAKVLVKKELVIGVEDTFPPFSYRNIYSGNLDGYDIELIMEICHSMGVKATYMTIDWAQKDFLLKNGEIDCIMSGFSYTYAREQIYTLSKPYIRTAAVLVVMENSPYRTIRDIREKRIAVQSASSLIETITMAANRHGNFSKLVFFDSADEQFEALEAGKVDAVLQDLLVVNTLIRSMRKPYKIIDEALGADEYVIAFRKGDIALKNKIDSIAKQLAETGEIEKITKKWFGANISIIGR